MTLIAYKNSCKCGCGEGCNKSYVKGHDKRKAPQQYIVDNETDCWIWSLAKDRDGYGLLKVANKRYRAHRYFYKKANGNIPDGKLICHSCDNPSCVNPKHLFIGTQKQNVADMYKKGRAVMGEDHHMSKLTRKKVFVIRRQYASGVMQGLLAKRYKVTQANISALVTNKTWKTN